MRLNKTIRLQIQRAVLADLPNPPPTSKHAQNVFSEWARKHCPDIENVQRRFPHLIRTGSICLPDGRNANGELTFPDWGDRVEVTLLALESHGEDTIRCLPKKYQDALIKIENAHSAWQSAKEKASEEVRRALESCATLKTLEERYPDLAKYAPAEVKSAGALAVEPELPCLKKAGWPAGKGRAGRAAAASA